MIRIGGRPYLEGPDLYRFTHAYSTSNATMEHLASKPCPNNMSRLCLHQSANNPAVSSSAIAESSQQVLYVQRAHRLSIRAEDDASQWSPHFLCSTHVELRERVSRESVTSVKGTLTVLLLLTVKIHVELP